jgi:hypothetical protein
MQIDPQALAKKIFNNTKRAYAKVYVKEPNEDEDDNFSAEMAKEIKESPFGNYAKPAAKLMDLLLKAQGKNGRVLEFLNSMPKEGYLNLYKMTFLARTGNIVDSTLMLYKVTTKRQYGDIITKWINLNKGVITAANPHLRANDHRLPTLEEVEDFVKIHFDAIMQQCFIINKASLEDSEALAKVLLNRTIKYYGSYFVKPVMSKEAKAIIDEIKKQKFGCQTEAVTRIAAKALGQELPIIAKNMKDWIPGTLIVPRTAKSKTYKKDQPAMITIQASDRLLRKGEEKRNQYAMNNEIARLRLPTEAEVLVFVKATDIKKHVTLVL